MAYDVVSMWTTTTNNNNNNVIIIIIIIITTTIVIIKWTCNEQFWSGCKIWLSHHKC